MAELSGKRVGELKLTSDIVATTDQVTAYIGEVSSDIRSDLAQEFIPLSSLTDEVLKIISANYLSVANLLDNGEIDSEISVDGGNSQT